ncbi:carbon-nitrogen hydrolase family protein [Pseudonocardia nematodicida]|uniref:Carbon-nitrogen hydrolase family protein n=1 Tax=Pseudonocardia nematodicida TaxID=1206997 RepID=A0ABV1K6U2_9PSEU
MPTPLTVAAAQPTCRPGDVAANVHAHADLVRRAAARVVVFPELSLTGYVLDSEDVEPNSPVVAPLAAACRETGTVALVGAPVVESGRRYIAVLAVDGDAVTVAYRKTWLGGDEADHFDRGDGPTVRVVDGRRLGLAICKDTGSFQHTAGTAALGIDVYVAGVVHRPDELAEQEARATVIARACAAHVVLAGAAGNVGPAYPVTAGTSAVWAPSGAVVVRAGPEPDAIALATLA